MRGGVVEGPSVGALHVLLGRAPRLRVDVHQHLGARAQELVFREGGEAPSTRRSIHYRNYWIRVSRLYRMGEVFQIFQLLVWTTS